MAAEVWFSPTWAVSNIASASSNSHRPWRLIVTLAKSCIRWTLMATLRMKSSRKSYSAASSIEVGSARGRESRELPSDPQWGKNLAVSGDAGVQIEDQNYEGRSRLMSCVK